MSIGVLIIVIVMTWIGYLLVGQQLITAFYNSQNSWIAGRFLAGAFTPVDAYYNRSDAVLVHGTLWLVVAYAAFAVKCPGIAQSHHPRAQ